jgi:hypothetical protein
LAARDAGAMPDLTEKLKEGISDAHAMETSVLRQFDRAGRFARDTSTEASGALR